MGWIFEVGKMFLYISFPVGIFYYVNTPFYFDKHVIKAKEEYFPPEDRQMGLQMENFIHEFNAKLDKQHLDILEGKSK